MSFMSLLTFASAVMTKVMSFVSEIFETIGEVVTGFGALIIQMFEAIVGIFYTTGTDGTGSITFVGSLLLFSAGTGLVIWGINWIRRLIRLRTRD